jgi:hypothetical protein
MNKKLWNVFISVWCLIAALLPLSATYYTINIPLQDYPQEEFKKHTRPINTFQMTKQVMKTYFYQPVSYGVYGLYNGILSSVNNVGFLSFPRSTQRPDFTIVVTQQIHPVMLRTNTISHWVLDSALDAAFYLVKQHKDPETKIIYWKTQQLNIPNDRVVPIHSIIILAKPEDVYIPLGITPTDALPNLVLPTIYIKRSLDPLKQALFILNIKQFFAPVQRLTKQNPLSYATHMTS